jgi:hypothetical protein
MCAALWNFVEHWRDCGIGFQHGCAHSFAIFMLGLAQSGLRSAYFRILDRFGMRGAELLAFAR